MAADSALNQLSKSLCDPWGEISPSYYDTAHVARAWARSPQRVSRSLGVPALSFLLEGQNADGSWGRLATPKPYRLVPTLAATVALGSLLQAALEVGSVDHVRYAFHRGLVYLTEPPSITMRDMPDTVAVEYIVPALFEQLHECVAHMPQYAGRTDRAMQPFREWTALLDTLREHARTGKAVPEQRDHCWESIDAAGVPVPPFRDGSIACSPAATVAALARSEASVPAAITYLSHSPPMLNGAQPVVLPLVIFERVWLLTALIHAGVPLPSAEQVSIAANLGFFWTPAGVGAAPGLAIEADDTSNYLLALLHLGKDVDLTCLLAFEGDDAFRTYHSVERNLSTSTNAHVLEAMEYAMSVRPELRRRYRTPAAKARDFLLSSQCEGGYWTDKWHASPLYATSCATFALAPTESPSIRVAMSKTIKWLLETQNDDGSWGVWCGTREETAYALIMLANYGERRAVTTAVQRGQRFLDSTDACTPDDDVMTPLWHSKELYSPLRYVRGLTLGAAYAARRITTKE